MEPDGFQLPCSKPPAWTGYGTTLELVEDLRWEMARRSGRRVTFGWYFRTDPQIAEVYGRPSRDDFLVSGGRRGWRVVMVPFTTYTETPERRRWWRRQPPEPEPEARMRYLSVEWPSPGVF